jgi:hypothetical protein
MFKKGDMVRCVKRIPSNKYQCEKNKVYVVASDTIYDYFRIRGVYGIFHVKYFDFAGKYRVLTRSKLWNKPRE